MAESSSLFEIIFMLFEALFNLAISVGKALIIGVFRFFSNPLVRTVSFILVSLLCIGIIRGFFKNRNKSMYKIV